VNKRGQFFFVTILCVVFVFSLLVPAWADTDYRCLNMCVRAGKPGTTCMSQCSYSLPVTSVPGTSPPTSAEQDLSGSTPKALADTLGNHRLLETLKPIDSNQILVNPKPASPYNESKDYHCLSQCLQSKMQYQACNMSCTTITTKNGQVVATTANGRQPQSEALARLQNRLLDQQSSSLSSQTSTQNSTRP